MSRRGILFVVMGAVATLAAIFGPPPPEWDMFVYSALYFGYHIGAIALVVFCWKRAVQGDRAAQVCIGLVLMAVSSFVVIGLRTGNDWQMAAVGNAFIFFISAPFASGYVAYCKNRSVVGVVGWALATYIFFWIPLFIVMWLPAKPTTKMSCNQRPGIG